MLALTTQLEVIARQFDEMEDEYLRERKADLEQVVERMLHRMKGTAAEVTPIRELDRVEIGSGSRGPVTEKIQSAFFDIVNGRNPKYAHWLTKV